MNQRVLRPIQVVAHRGASQHAVENTISSFRLASERGADMIELDIHQSLDGKPVVFHDDFMLIPNDGVLPVSQMTLATLQSIELADSEHIPAFESVLALCKEVNLGLYLEFKDDSPELIRRIVETVRGEGLLENTVFFGARPDTVYAVKSEEATARTCISYRQPGIDPILLARACRADGLNLAWEDFPEPHRLITEMWLARVRAEGLRVMSWHEERESELRTLIDLGIDDLCTNDPALARRLIVAQTTPPV